MASDRNEPLGSGFTTAGRQSDLAEARSNLLRIAIRTQLERKPSVNRLTALHAFVAVVEHGSFAAAARATGASNAAVSKNVRELEADLGVRLFHRTTRTMRVTDAGALYYERMRKLLGEMAEADDAVSGFASDPTGRLRVTAPMSIGLLRLAPLIPRFLTEHPGITIDLRMDDDKNDLVHGGFDLAIRGTAALPDSTLISRKLADLTHVLIAGRAYADRLDGLNEPDDLAAHPCLLYANADRPDRWTLRRTAGNHAGNGKAEELTVRVAGPLVANNSLAIRHAVLAGTGIALMPRLYVEDDLVSGAVLSVLEGWSPIDQSVFAVYPPGPTVLPRVRAFIDFLARHLRGFEAMTPAPEDVADVDEVDANRGMDRD